MGFIGRVRAGAEKFGGGFTGFCRWIADRFDFWVIYRGERLRPEVLDRLDEEDEAERRGEDVYSPAFTNVEDMRKWLRRNL